MCPWELIVENQLVFINWSTFCAEMITECVPLVGLLELTCGTVTQATACD
jgi:hypothetical protein